MGVKFKGFDTDKLIKDITRDLEKDLKKHPEKLLDGHKGETVCGKCSICGNTEIEILPHGKARCKKCGLITKVNLNMIK